MQVMSSQRHIHINGRSMQNFTVLNRKKRKKKNAACGHSPAGNNFSTFFFFCNLNQPVCCGKVLIHAGVEEPHASAGKTRLSAKSPTLRRHASSVVTASACVGLSGVVVHIHATVC